MSMKIEPGFQEKRGSFEERSPEGAEAKRAKEGDLRSAQLQEPGEEGHFVGSRSGGDYLYEEYDDQIDRSGRGERFGSGLQLEEAGFSGTQEPEATMEVDPDDESLDDEELEEGDDEDLAVDEEEEDLDERP